MALHPILWDQPAIGIPIDICQPYGADFDGDQVACFFVTEQSLVAEINDYLRPSRSWFYEKTKKPIYTPTHEILLGLYYASKVGPIKRSKPNEFPTYNDLEKAYKDGKVEYDDLIKLDDKPTTYGRARLEKIIGRELSPMLDTKEGEMAPITVKNIGKVISVMANDYNRADKVRDLNELGAEIVTHHGMDTPPFQQLYDFNDPEFKALVNSEEPTSIKYNKLNQYIHGQVDKTIANLPDNNLNDLLRGSGRVKMGQMYDIYAPVLYGDGTVSNSTLFQGYTERDFISKGLENRKVQEIKKLGVPMSGFISRQMILTQINIRYRDYDGSPDRIGLRIPRREAVGRTMLDGRKIRSFNESNGDDLVTVKSCLNHDEPFVYRDEIDQDTLHEKDGASIGISFAMSLTEAKTQSVLALKHGGISRTYEDAKIRALNSGIVDDITSDYLTIRTSVNTIDRYLLSGVISLAHGISIGEHVQAGQVLVQSRRMMQLFDKVADLCDFLGFQNSNADIGMTREKGRGKVMCYAPHDGVITYPTPNIIKIGETEIPVNQSEVYYYPEGYKVKKLERFCSGLADIKGFKDYDNNTQDCFDALKKGWYEIEYGNIIGDTKWRNPTSSELLELAYKCLVGAGFSARAKYTRTRNFLERMVYGDTKRGLESFYKEAQGNAMPIQDSVVMPIILGFKPE